MSLLPQDVLSSRTDIVVVVTVGLDNEIRNGDSDPKFFLSDGARGIGFELQEGIGISGYRCRGNRCHEYHCRGLQGLMGETYGRSLVRFSSATVTPTSFLPKQFVMTIKPSQRWESCYTASDGGMISPVSFEQSIFLDRGLWLEVYREDNDEKLSINYISVEIHEN